MNDPTNTKTSDRGASHPERGRIAALWLTAAALTALILAQAGGLLDARASAEMAASSGGVSMMTTRSGSLEPLFVVDDRTETLFVYKVEQDRFELWDKRSLPEMFANARSRHAVKP